MKRLLSLEMSEIKKNKNKPNNGYLVWISVNILKFPEYLVISKYERLTFKEI